MNLAMKECPVCSGKTIIRRIACTSCNTEISGDFEMPTSKFELEQELMDFLRVFILSEGSIKQSEKLLNCSYPKIKNLLKKTKLALGLETEIRNENKSIIDRLDEGEIDVEEALKALGSDKQK